MKNSEGFCPVPPAYCTESKELYVNLSEMPYYTLKKVRQTFFKSFPLRCKYRETFSFSVFFFCLCCVVIVWFVSIKMDSITNLAKIVKSFT